MAKYMIPKSLLEQFRDKLRVKTADGIDEVLIFLDDLDLNEPISVRDLSKTIPEDVRSEIIRKSQELILIHNELASMIDQLTKVADAASVRALAIEEAAKPHCDRCGQVIKPKPKGKKRK